MTQWYVKELSQLTGVSVQTLHHYDRIDLLNPSLRLANGYRVYNQTDLLRLQQIIALKFFGFELAQIKALLKSEKDAISHFTTQIECLEARARTMLDASQLLKNILNQGHEAKTIPWKSIIEIIEVYRMSEQLEHRWVKEIFTPEELKEYAQFESDWKASSTSEQKASFETSWSELIAEIEAHLPVAPNSTQGIALGEKCMRLVNGVYGKKYAKLRTKKFEEGFAKGKGLQEVGLTAETVAWLDKAIDAYWDERAKTILEAVKQDPSNPSLEKLWQTLMGDMFGDDSSGKKSHMQKLINQYQPDSLIHNWLKRQ